MHGLSPGDNRPKRGTDYLLRPQDLVPRWDEPEAHIGDLSNAVLSGGDRLPSTTQRPTIGRRHRPTRRQLLAGIALAGVGGMAGCLGDDDGDDQTPSPTPATTPPDGDDTPDENDDTGQELDVVGGVTSMVSEVWYYHEIEGMSVNEYELEYHLDHENNRMKQVVNHISEDFYYEAYHINDTVYQVMDDQCFAISDVPLNLDGQFILEDPGELEDTGNYDLAGTDTFRGHTVEVWTITDEHFVLYDEGSMTAYLDPDSGYLIGLEGEFIHEEDDTGDTIFRFEQYFHSHNQDLGIEIPEVCEDANGDDWTDDDT